MALFNAKQEILDIELTSFGKQQLSKGEFKPSFYTFIDDNIVYDAAYASGTDEVNGGADTRIRTLTPYLKTNYSLIGSEFKVTKHNPNDKEISLVTTYENEHLLKYSLGNSKIGEATGSYYDLRFLEGEINSVETTGSLYKFNNRNAVDLKIPKVIAKTMKFTPQIKSMPSPDLRIPPELIDPDNIEKPIVSPILTDGKYVRVDFDKLLFILDEINSTDEYENFEINLYKIDQNNEGEEMYIKLPFANEQFSEIDEEGFLIDDKDRPKYIAPTTKNAEYYFNILVDEEINAELISSKIPRDRFGAPRILDPLIKDVRISRTRAKFLKDGSYDGEPC